ncbi:MAG TPA: putative zinc-binding protein [Luteimonas sp.]|nr:putative zinc-binding protein [Luteimonas sp.]
MATHATRGSCGSSSNGRIEAGCHRGSCRTARMPCNEFTYLMVRAAMRRKPPLVYSCSGCSSAAQMANQLAIRLDRDGGGEAADMSEHADPRPASGT